MKSKLVTSVLILASTCASQAVIVQYSTTFTQAVTNLAGTLIPDQGGYTAVGYFSIADSAIPTASATDLATAFKIFGASGIFGISQIGGVYQNVAGGGRVGAAPAGPNADFLGKNIYVLNTNALTIGASSEALVFKSNQVFTDDSALAADTEFVVDLGANGNYIFGGQAGSSIEIAPGFTVPTIKTAVLIPEPSAALLGALGALGLLRRRRI